MDKKRKRVIHVLGCCGAGTVTSTMLATRVGDILDDMKVPYRVTTVVPMQVEGFVERGGVDFIITSSPIPGKVNVPVIKGVSLLSGFGEEETIEEIKKVINKILETEN